MAAQYFHPDDRNGRVKTGSPQIVSYEHDGLQDSAQIREKSQPEHRYGYQTPATVAALFSAAIGFILGHHFYYQSLKGTVVPSEDQQSWSIRLGTGAAVFTKTALVALIGIAAVQRIWATLRRKAMTLRGIDGMFGIMGDPTWIFNSELLGHAKLLMLFAVVSWCVPLITIITPATLSVQPVLSTVTIPSAVRTVNFSNPGNEWYTSVGAGMIGNPGPEISRLFNEVYSSRGIKPMRPPFPNASYDLSFWGPSYKCSPASEVFANANTPTWNTSLATSEYKSFEEAYYASLPAANRSRFEDPKFYKGVKYQATAPKYMDNTLLVFAEGDNNPIELICQLYNTTYSLSISFTNGNQTITPHSITPFVPAAFPATVGQNSLLNSLSSTAVGDGRANATFYVTHLLFSNLLSAEMMLSVSLQLSLKSNNISTTSIALTDSAIPYCPDIAKPFITSGAGYFNNTGACRNGTLAAAIEDLSRNFTMSTLAYQFWDDGSAMATVDVTRTFPENRYAYQAETLWIAYGVALALTLLCLILGGIAMYENGVTSSTAFSTVLLTTRNRDLDVLASGRELGSKPLADDVAGVKMRFGYLVDGEEGRGGHVGFGLAGTVVAMGERR